MLSGGMDSVAAAYRMLRDTPYALHAHHVRLLNRHGRADAELTAVEASLDWLAHAFGDRIEYTQSAIDTRALAYAVPDVMPVMNIAAGLGLALAMEYGPVIGVACGLRWCDPKADNHPAMAGWSRQEHDAYYRHRTLQNRERFPPLLAPLLNEPRAETIRSLPKDLLLRTWSCRTPVPKEGGWRPCGGCVTCQELAEAGYRHHEAADYAIGGSFYAEKEAIMHDGRENDVHAEDQTDADHGAGAEEADPQGQGSENLTDQEAGDPGGTDHGPGDGEVKPDGPADTSQDGVE